MIFNNGNDRKAYEESFILGDLHHEKERRENEEL